MVQSTQDRAADDIPGPLNAARDRDICSMTSECAWRCSNLCTIAERGADDVRRIPRHDQCIPSGLNRSTVLRSRCQKQSTALVSLDQTQTFLVTHVFHPLYGRELRLTDQYLAWGEDRVCFRDDKGGLRYLPTAWTSIAPPDPFVRTSAGRSHFRVEDLLRLASLIAKQTPAQRPRARQRRRRAV